MRASHLRAYILTVAVGALVGGFLAVTVFAEIPFESLHWANPGALWLTAACGLVAWAGLHLRVLRSSRLVFSSVAPLTRVRQGWVRRWVGAPVSLRMVAIALIAVALARPQTFRNEDIDVEGIDVMFALDLSQSMEETDLERTRLDAGQRTIRRFVRSRKGDRLGLVVFAREAMLESPLTLDYAAFDQAVASVRIGDVPAQGTAIGDGLGLALATLLRSDSATRIVVLLSDGDSNVSNEIDPQLATQLARNMEVRVYTVLLGHGAGEEYERRYATNPALLANLAEDTGGKFFRAADVDALTESFREISRELETSRHRVSGRVPDRELYGWFLGPAVLLLGVEWLLLRWRWRRAP